MIVIVCWVLCLATGRVFANPPTKLASTNLCSDLLLLQVADPGQIVALSEAATDPRHSALSAQAARYPTIRGSVEELLRLSPDLALVYQGWDGRGHGGLLLQSGTDVVPLPYPSSWSDALASMRALARLIGRAPQAELLIAAAEDRLVQLGDRLGPWRVLYLRPSGGSAGQGTYVDDLLRRLGLRNMASEYGLRGWGRFPLERLVIDPPDLFILGFFDQRHPPSQSRYARHPILRGLLERTPVIAIPSGGWGCGGIEMVEVAEAIVRRVEQHPRFSSMQRGGRGAP